MHSNILKLNFQWINRVYLIDSKMQQATGFK